MRIRSSKAFTLVEILIVVVILGILAAIVIPQFTNASQEAQRGNVVTQLQTIRNQIELFRVRNNGISPVMAGAQDASFSELITPPTNPPGQQPYMRSPASNPRNSSNVVTADSASGNALLAAAAAIDPNSSGAAGWLYNATTGDIAAVGYSEWSKTWFGEAGHVTTAPGSAP
jgi:general secretion pathway protein G